MTSLSWQAWGPWNGYTSILNCTQVHHLSEYIFIVVFHYWIVFMPCWRALYVKVEMLWMHISRGLNSVLGHSILNGVWYNTCSSVESDTPQPGSLSLSLSCGSLRTSHLNLSWLTVQDLSSLFHRRMTTLRKVTSQSTRGLLPPSISPKWTPPSQRSCSRCPRRAGLWWSLLQCQEIPQRRRRRRSQACGRAASSTPTMIFRGSHSLNSFKDSLSTSVLLSWV